MRRPRQTLPPASARSRLERVNRVLKGAIIAVGLLCALAAGLFGAALYKVRDQEGSQALNAARLIVEEAVGADYIFAGRNRVNILLIGEDVSLTNRRQIVKEPSRSDTNILISLDRLNQTAHLLSLPRDTKVNIPGHGTNKLNAAHRFGGPLLLINTIERNFGLRVDHYLKTNFHGFVELVDLLGGIDIYVERDMDYDDNWQDFHVHLKQGQQHLTGEQAHGYVRWRKSKNGDSDPKGDLGRIERQQKVIKILARQALAPQNLPKLRAMIRTARKYIDTDLTDRQLFSLLVFLQKLDPETLDTATLPGEWTGLYIEVWRNEARELLAAMFGQTFDETALSASWTTEESDRGRRLPDVTPARVRELEEPIEEFQPLAEEEFEPASPATRPADLPEPPASSSATPATTPATPAPWQAPTRPEPTPASATPGGRPEPTPTPAQPPPSEAKPQPTPQPMPAPPPEDG